MFFSKKCFSYEDEISIFLQTFKGEKELSWKVTTIIELQLMKTLRIRGPSTPKGVTYGKGKIYRNNVELEINNFKEADAIAMHKSNLSQAILWGKVWGFLDGVAVQSFLSIPRYEDYRTKQNELWTIELIINKKKYKFVADIPNRRYELPVIILSNSIVEKYSSPDLLPLYSDIKKTSIISYLGSNGEYSFTAIEHRGDYSKIKLGNQSGWIYLPRLTESNSQIIYFIGGLIRLYRGDYLGSAKYFSEFLSYSDIPTSLRVDALLYTVLTKWKSRLSYKKELDYALKLNSYSPAVYKYLVMGLLSDFKVESNKNKKAKYLSKIKEIINENRYLFSKSDLWLNTIEKLLRASRGI